MKPETAAKKLGILLEAAPEEFREGVVTRDELNQLLYHAGLGPRGRRPTLWHALRDLQPSRPGEPGAVATAS